MTLQCTEDDCLKPKSASSSSPLSTRGVAAEEFPRDSSTHKGDTLPIFCSARHCTDCRTYHKQCCPLCYNPQWCTTALMHCTQQPPPHALLLFSSKPFCMTLFCTTLLRFNLYALQGIEVIFITTKTRHSSMWSNLVHLVHLRLRKLIFLGHHWWLTSAQGGRSCASGARQKVWTASFRQHLDVRQFPFVKAQTKDCFLLSRFRLGKN